MKYFSAYCVGRLADNSTIGGRYVLSATELKKLQQHQEVSVSEISEIKIYTVNSLLKEWRIG